MKKIIFSVLAVITALSLLACNTVQGVGRDIKQGGQAIERAATK